MKDTRKGVKVKVEQVVIMNLNHEKQQEFNTRTLSLHLNSQ